MRQYIQSSAGSDHWRECSRILRVTRLTPNSAKSIPTSRVAPGSKRRLDVAISNAKSYSNLSSLIELKNLET